MKNNDITKQTFEYSAGAKAQFNVMKMCGVCLLVFALIFSIIWIIAIALTPPCMQINPEREIDMFKYQGTWYEMYYHEPKDDGSKCGRQTIFYDHNDDNKYKIENTDWFGDRKSSQTTSVIKGTLKVDPSQEYAGNLLLNMPGKYNTPYQILRTDYKNYSIVYSCQHFWGVGRSEYMWIYMRNKLNSAVDD